VRRHRVAAPAGRSPAGGSGRGRERRHAFVEPQRRITFTGRDFAALGAKAVEIGARRGVPNVHRRAPCGMFACETMKSRIASSAAVLRHDVCGT
jgi:hypothetical protein